MIHTIMVVSSTPRYADSHPRFDGSSALATATSHISTNFIERSKLSMEFSIRRLTRLTNAFSKKFVNRFAAVSIDLMYYNFGGIRQTVRCKPAMQAYAINSRVIKGS
jgi:hypothetical protein